MEKDENSKQKILNAATKLFAHKVVDAVIVITRSVTTK